MYPGTWAKQFPNKAAVINAATGETLSFAQLDARSNQLAHALWNSGLRPGDHLALFMENHLRFFEVLWAALRSGLYITAVNRHLTAEEAGYIINDCDAQVLITSMHLAEKAAALPLYTPKCHARWMIEGTLEDYTSYEAAIADTPTTPLAAQPAGQTMLYSSGTTGRPKGILRPRLAHQIDSAELDLGVMQRTLWGFDEHTMYLSPAPLYHAAPIGFCTATTALGGTIVMLPRFDEQLALAAIEEHRVTHSQWVPTMFTRLLKLPDSVRHSFDLSSHKIAVHAAAPCPIGIKQQMFQWWGDIIYEYYGGTERNGITHINPAQWHAHPGSVGLPFLGEVHICDEQGAPLPAGETGIVYFALPTMPFTYHNDRTKTQSVQHPTHSNWSALGDVGYVDTDGFLYLTDRASFMIISGGVNIYPQETEDALIMHPAVADVAVFGVPDPEMGESVKAVVQLTDPTADTEAMQADLLQFARDRLAGYKCPKSIDFVSELPRLPTGKLYKRLLKDRYWGNTQTRIV